MNRKLLEQKSKSQQRIHGQILVQNYYSQPSQGTWGNLVGARQNRAMTSGIDTLSKIIDSELGEEYQESTVERQDFRDQYKNLDITSMFTYDRVSPAKPNKSMTMNLSQLRSASQRGYSEYQHTQTLKCQARKHKQKIAVSLN